MMEINKEIIINLIGKIKSPFLNERILNVKISKTINTKKRSLIESS
jgi:hypothetical protein